MALRTWRLEGPEGTTWSIWDFGDELTVHDGPGLLDNVVARVPVALCQRLDEGGRTRLMESAAGSIHVARLLNGDPTFHLLWR